MLRWLIAILVLANVVAFALASGILGPLPASGPREPNHLNRQIHPEWLRARPISAGEANDQAIVGKAVSAPAMATSPLTQ
jgi:hypothetical protein